MQRNDLLATADDLIGTASGQPRQSNLRRAVSTTHCAMFHCQARCCADTLAGGSDAKSGQPEWRQVYRSLEHGLGRRNCSRRELLSRFPPEITEFANEFVLLQKKRHFADYDPEPTFTKSEVEGDIEFAKDVLERFEAASMEDRRSFAIFVLFRIRSNP